jgi:hypothetical protein
MEPLEGGKAWISGKGQKARDTVRCEKVTPEFSVQYFIPPKPKKGEEIGSRIKFC